MTTFYICRHGETENNKAQKLSGWIDTPLTDLGIQNAHASAVKVRNIPIDIIISSDLGRAFNTAYIIARDLEYENEIIRDRLLREVNYGDLANKTYDNYPTLTPEENENYVTPNGESLHEMQSRVLKRMKELSHVYEGKHILVVGHDGTINAIRAHVLGENMGIADQTHNAHDFVAKVECRDGTIVSFDEL